MPRRRSAVDAELAALYAQVPEVPCRGLCQFSCGPIDMSGRERQRLRERGVRVPLRQEGLRRLADGGPGTGGGGYACPALDEAGGCSVHDIRPMVCRLWGATASLPCPHGCTPEAGLLDDADALDLLAASLRAGGAPADLADVPPDVGQALRESPRLRRVVGDYVRSHRPPAREPERAAGGARAAAAAGRA